MPARDRDIVSDKEYFRKTADIFEHVLGIKINLTYKSAANYFKYLNANTAEINLATPNVKGINKGVALYHELGHANGRSPINAAEKIIRKWCGDDMYKMHLFFNAFNVLEDQRVESIMGRIYLKYANEFRKTRKGLGKKCNDDVKNPVNALLLARFMRDDIIENQPYYDRLIKSLDDVEYTDRYGGLKVLGSIKDLIDCYADKQTERYDELIDKQKKEGKLEDKEHNELVSIHNDMIKQKMDMTRTKQTCKTKDDVDDTPEELFDDPSNVNYDNILSESKSMGEYEIESILNSIKSKDIVIDRTPPDVVLIERSEGMLKPNQKISNGMKKIFKKLQMRTKEYIDYDGHTIDVEEFIKGRLNGYDMGNCMVNEKKTHGVSILISVDASTSMEDSNRIDSARNLIATLYKSIENIDDVDIRANVWGGNGNGDVGITEIKSYNDVKHVTVDRYYPVTPTHSALDYSSRMLKEMKGDRKLFIMITDGMPNYYKNSYNIPLNTYVKMCQKSFRKLLTVTPDVMVILVGYHSNGAEYAMKKIFKAKRMMFLPNMNKASETVIKHFRKTILRAIAR